MPKTMDQDKQALQLDEAAEQTLRLAGYGLEDETQRRMGVLAFHAAALVHAAAAQQASGGRPGRIRRNDPCPCGSGKKYKKCCFATGKPLPDPSLGSAAASAPPDPEIVPRLLDGERTSRDLGQLGSLLERDPDLRRLRWSGSKVARYLAAQSKDGPELEGEQLDRFVEQVAQRYADTEPDGAELLGRLLEPLTRAARKPRSKDELRALALGVLYAALEGDRSPHQSFGPNPLVCAIFRLSLNEELRRRAKGMTPKRGQAGALAGAHGKLAPEVAAELQHSGERMLEDLRRCIRQARFPVLLPNASLLPLFSRIEQRQRTTPAPSRDEVRAMVERAVGEWVPEDRRLFGELLEAWSEKNPGAAPEAIGQVRSVQALVAGECLEPLDEELALAAVRQGRGSPVAGEPPPTANESEITLSVEYLERYGDFLVAKGFPVLGRRTYALCAEQGPMPASVADKLGRLTKR